jgi:hypothetical protein
MDRRTFMKTIPAIALMSSTKAGYTKNQESVEGLEPMDLLPPKKEGGLSVLASLQERKTYRNISPKKLDPQTLSNLLWAAFGVNRAQASFNKPGRTAASASNSQEIDLYIAMEEGVYLYDAVPHRLVPVLKEDIRALAGRRSAATAPINIFYVVDKDRYVLADWQPDKRIREPEVQKSYYYVDTGLIAQNVYLFAASQNLAAWFHNCNKEQTAKKLKLGTEQLVLFAQTVGYPA